MLGQRQLKIPAHFLSGVLAAAAAGLELLFVTPAPPRPWDVHKPHPLALLKGALSCGLVASVFLAANVLRKIGSGAGSSTVNNSGMYHFYCCEIVLALLLVEVAIGSMKFSQANLLFLGSVALAFIGYMLQDPVQTPRHERDTGKHSPVQQPLDRAGARLSSKGLKQRSSAKPASNTTVKQADSTTIEKPRRNESSICATIFGLLVCLIGLALVLGYIAFRVQEPYTSCFGSLSKIPPLTSEVIAKDKDGIVRYSVGAFMFAFNTQLKQLAVSHSSEPERAIFDTNPGEAFVTVALGEFKALNKNTHDGGAFTITDTPELYSTETHIRDIVQESIDSVVVIGDLLFKNKPSIPFTMTYKSVEGSTSRVSFHVKLDKVSTHELAGDSATRIYINHRSRKEEHFFGFGSTPLDIKGGCVPILTSEQGVGRGLQPLTFLINKLVPGGGGSWQTTYTAIPHYVTSDMRSSFMENTEFMVFDLSHDTRVTVEVVTATYSASGQVIYGKTPQDLIAGYTEWSGRMRPLPDWTSKGAIVGLQGGTEMVKRKLEVLKDSNVPISALWLQDWTGKVETGFGRRLLWDWKLNIDHYPGWHEWIQELAKDGIYVMTYINPYVISWGTMYPEAEAMGCLVMKPDGSVYVQASATPDFTFGTIDLTNPKCNDWYVNVMRNNMLNVTATGTDLNNIKGAIGWMADFSEMLPMDAVLHAGDARQVHNEFPTLWAEACHKAIDVNEEFAREAVFFMRAGGSRQPKYNTLQWLGDQLVTFDEYDGMASALSVHLTLGLSGYSFIHSDIGGYTMIQRFPFEFLRSRQLLLRWMEMNAFLDSVYRTHEGNKPDQSAQVYDDPEIAAVFSRFSNIHVALGEYRKQLMKDVTNYGMPLARSLFLHYPDDRNTYSLSKQFMLGSELIACPVLTPDTDSVQCYIPAHSGNWRHLWTGKEVAGGPNGQTVNCFAPIGKPCVWYKADSRTLDSFVDKLKKLGYVQPVSGKVKLDECPGEHCPDQE